MDNKFDGFVGIFDNVLPENYCTDIIKYFEDLDKTGFIQSTYCRRCYSGLGYTRHIRKSKLS